MNKYFTTRSVNRPWNIGDTRTIIYCDNNRESIAMIYRRFPNAWYTISVAVGDEVHSVIEGISYPVGAIVWAYMYNGNMQTIAVQHQ